MIQQSGIGPGPGQSSNQNFMRWGAAMTVDPARPFPPQHEREIASAVSWVTFD